jgi:hypothetical protein
MGYDNTKETTKGLMMPSVSDKQKKMMAAAAANPKFAAQVGIKQSVHAADIKSETSGKVNRGKK